MSVATGRPGGIAVAVALGVLVGVVVTAGLIVTDDAGGQPVRDPHGAKEAAAYAESLLDRVPLPQGARPFTGALPMHLAGAPESTTFDTRVFRHRIYSVSAPPDAALAYVKARGIPGFQAGGSGAGGPLVGPPTVTYDVYGEQRPPPGVYVSDLTLSTTASGPRASLLRIDAQVVWRQLRTAAEHVPVSARVVTIDRTILPQPERMQRTTQRWIVTDRVVVARLAQVVNVLPTMPSGGVSTGLPHCPAVNLVVTFASSTGGSPDVVVSTDPECLARIWGVTAGGKSQPAIQDTDGAFLAAVTAAER